MPVRNSKLAVLVVVRGGQEALNPEGWKKLMPKEHDVYSAP